MRTRRFKHWLKLFAFGLLCSACSQAWADDAGTQTGLQGKPKWEFGLGAGYLDGFDYPGSIDTSRRTGVLPFFIYRSERVRLGGGGFSAVAIDKPRLRLDWSLGASLRATSEGNSLRAGMDDLGFLFELGPKLILRIVDTTSEAGQNYRLDWSTKLRGVLSTDGWHLDGRGVVLESTLDGSIRGIGGDDRLAIGAGLSVTGASEQLQDYFYEVDEEFVTDQRPAFDAEGGLLEINARVGMAVRLPHRVRVFVGVSTGFYHDAVNRDSPLHRAVQTTSAAVGVVWTVAQSKERVGIFDIE